MVEWLSTLWSKKQFCCCCLLRDLAMHFFTSSSHANVQCKKYLKMFPIDKFLPFLSTMRGSSSGSKSCEIVVWWFGDWFMLCKTLIWSLWPIVSKGSIKMRPPFLPLCCFETELKSVSGSDNSCMHGILWCRSRGIANHNCYVTTAQVYLWTIGIHWRTASFATQKVVD